MSSLKMMLSLALAIALSAIAVLLHGAFTPSLTPLSPHQPVPSSAIDFVSCAQEAGSSVESGTPVICRTADGRVFAAPAPASTASTTAPFIGPGCKVGGCSSELCVDADSDDVISTCIARPQFACYKTARCEVQPSGHCGWTADASLTQCIASTSPDHTMSSGYIRMEVQ
ncbi:MAG TPA: hypothetical protein VFL98_00460 [Candidatus Paceibacterota bacterium]|nr:hypothetical protein [Candidatus Paceibacterota bacterium]